MSAEMEKTIMERMCPGEKLSQVESYFPTLVKISQERLTTQKASENAKLVATHYKCKFCKNFDQGLFSEDTRRAQITCLKCGSVVEDRKVHDGEWKRQFADEDNPSQHGPIPDPRFSSGHNLRTNITLGGLKGPGGKVTKKDLMDLKNIQERVEMNLSNMQFGVDVRTTRIGYKDKQKKEVFQNLDDIGESLQLHQKIIDSAKGYFADYRSAKEQIQNRDTVAASCLILSLRDALGAGESILAASTSASSTAAVTSAAADTKKRKLDLAGDPNNPNSKRPQTIEELNPYPCKTCIRRFSTKKDLRFHARDCKAKAAPPSQR